MSHEIYVTYPCNLDESKGALRTDAGGLEAASEPQAKRKPSAKIGLEALLHGAIYNSNEVGEESDGEVARYFAERTEGIEVQPLEW